MIWLPDLRIAERLAAFAQEFKLENVPAAITERVRLALLDTVGCMAYGSMNSSSMVMQAVVGDVSSPKLASVVGTRIRTWPPLAALANGTMAHRLDFDDGITRACGLHVGVTLVPALFALGESMNSSGGEILASAIVGYEIAARIGRPLRSRILYLNGFHAQGVLAGFAAASACAHLLGLEQEQIINVLSTTACLAPVSPYDAFTSGGMTKDAYAGWPSMLGIMACYLTMNGFTSPSDIFESKLGFYKLLADKYGESEIFQGIGEQFVFPEAHYFKPHSTCRLVDNPADCALSIVRTNQISPDQVKRITISTSEVVWALTRGGPSPINDIQARASMHYCVAAAILYGDLSVDRFSDVAISNPGVHELANKIEVLVNPELLSIYPKRPTEVTIITKEGRSYTETVFSERSLDKSGVIQKFRNLATRVYTPEAVEKLEGMILDIARVSDISHVMELLRK